MHFCHLYLEGEYNFSFIAFYIELTVEQVLIINKSALHDMSERMEIFSSTFFLRTFVLDHFPSGYL